MRKALWGTTILSGAAFAISTSPAKGATVVVGFQDATDATKFFQNNDGTARVVFNPSVATGIADQVGGLPGGSFFAANPSLDATAVLQTNSINLTSGTTTVSTLLNYAVKTAQIRTQIGVVNKPGLSFNGENPPNPAFITSRLMSDGTIQFQTKTAAGTTVTTNLNSGSAIAGFNANNWYQFIVSMNETDPTTGAFSVNTIVNDVGPTGTNTATTIFSDLNRTVTVSDFSTANQGTLAFAGVRTANGTNTTLAIDNFTVDGNLSPAPEPGTIGLLGAGLGAFLLRRRR